MTTLCLFECQGHNTFMLKLCSYYVRLLHSTLIYSYYIQKMSKLHPLWTKVKRKILWRWKHLILLFSD